jgi:hypothetical protein
MSKSIEARILRILYNRFDGAAEVIDELYERMTKEASQ